MLRDAAIVLLGLRMGFRASDVLNLHFRDIDWKNREISIIMKKTKTQITLPMPVDVGNTIYAYISNGRPKNGSEFIFIRSKAPYGRLTGKVCTKALYRILPERKEVTGGGFHVTRRTFATNLLRNHAKINEVMDALGHQDSTSIMKYLLLDEERSRRCGLSLKDAGLPMRGGLV
ncbi:MAG: tyrosine-type recombinase/integrase [Hungatella sp.]|jgi:integrase|nr:tyrosine-type recombinase/integrase [Hungatella sp.]